MSGAVYRLSARVVGVEAAEAVLALLDAAAQAVAAFETPGREWRLDSYGEGRRLTPALAAQLALAAIANGGELLELGEEKLARRDWLAENQQAFPPLRIGRFFVRGSHCPAAVPPGAIGIVLDAATAFGTGEHPSTRGCLAALEEIARRRRIRRPLDIGTGTGILAIAAAKLLRRPVLAGDIDQGAVSLARYNAAHNGVAGLVRVKPAKGYRTPPLPARAYDLVLANILARPLALMARDLARVLAPGGRAVLSGLLRGQERIVLAPHLRLGLALERRFVIDGWSTLVLRAGCRPSCGAVGN
jgi:ribosomal protein L11 methyltransferase